MTAPVADPIIVQILDAVAGALAKISQARGFYNDVAKAGIEPIALNAQSQYPQIAVREAGDKVDDSNGKGAVARSATIEAYGVAKVGTTNAMRDAHKLRNDMERVMRSISVTTFSAAGVDAVNKWGVLDEAAIDDLDSIAEGYVAVTVKVPVEYRDFSPPVQGI